MRKEYFLHAWNLFELGIVFIGIIDVVLDETQSIDGLYLDEIVLFLKALRLLRAVRILKVKNY